MTLKDGFPHLLANFWRGKPHKPAWVPLSQGLKVNCSFEAPGWRRHDLFGAVGCIWDVFPRFFLWNPCYFCLYLWYCFVFLQHCIVLSSNFANTPNMIQLLVHCELEFFFIKHMSTLFSPSCLIYLYPGICFFSDFRCSKTSWRFLHAAAPSDDHRPIRRVARPCRPWPPPLRGRAGQIWSTRRRKTQTSWDHFRGCCEGIHGRRIWGDLGFRMDFFCGFRMISGWFNWGDNVMFVCFFEILRIHLSQIGSNWPCPPVVWGIDLDCLIFFCKTWDPWSIAKWCKWWREVRYFFAFV